MTSPASRPLHPSTHSLDQAADFHILRERAHRERTRAINAAFSALWSRMTGGKARQEHDAGFWNA